MITTRLRVVCVIILIAVSSADKESKRWSRQISSYTADVSDWVPLPGPVEETSQIKKQTVAEPRILADPYPGFIKTSGFNPEAFPSRTYYQSPANKQLYLQSLPAVPSAPQNFLSDQGFRFSLSQPNFPLSQGFVTPDFSFDNMPKQMLPALSKPIKFETLPKSLPSSQAKPFNFGQITKTEPSKYIDNYRIENTSTPFNNRKPQSLQKIKFDNFENVPVPIPFSSSQQSKPKIEREEVQLLYVPVDSLNRGQNNLRHSLQNFYNPHILNADLYSQALPKQNTLRNPSTTFNTDVQKGTVKPAESYSFGQNQDFYHSNINSPSQKFDQVPKFSTISTHFPTVLSQTPKPKKLKPHQPPLAIFLVQQGKLDKQVKVGDVLYTLKNAKTVPVLDSVDPATAPNVFIGPNSLTPLDNYVKFELPYLSNIENSDKKLRQLPFFVAPLSYKTPNGFAKIPFPSPHVGSVVINSQIVSSTPSVETSEITSSQYSTPKQDKTTVNKNPNISYYATSASPTHSLNQQLKYSFEPQTVTSIGLQSSLKEIKGSITPKPDPYLGSHFKEYNNAQYVQFPQNHYSPHPVTSNYSPIGSTFLPYENSKISSEYTSTTSTTTATPRQHSTSSPWLETHNPYSINQAFHFSTPADYQNYFDENKDSYVTPSFSPFSSAQSNTASVTTSFPLKTEEITEKQSAHSLLNYNQNYRPEIQQDSEIQANRYPSYDKNDFINKGESATVENKNLNYITNSYISTTPHLDMKYKEAVENTQIDKNNNKEDQLSTQESIDSLKESYEINSFNKVQSFHEVTEATLSSTTTTRRSPIRNRGRPKYTTTPKTGSDENTRKVVTRRPQRERKPLPSRSHPEINKIVIENPVKISENSYETKLSKTKTRGHVQYKPTDDEEIYNIRVNSNSNDSDLAYQRDILHQNYPVTLMEKFTTLNVDTVTEPLLNIHLIKNFETGALPSDTENADTNQNVAFSNNELKFKYSTEDNIKVVTENSSTQHEDDLYQTKSSPATFQSQLNEEDKSATSNEYSYHNSDISDHTSKTPVLISYSTESVRHSSEQSIPFSFTNKISSVSEDRSPEINITTETSFQSELFSDEEKPIETTPSYNRVRIRPGVIKQTHKPLATDPSSEKKKSVQTITYRPAFDRRRTTMRIEEIGEDLKTKQVRSRPESQEYRHPVYKPELTSRTNLTSTTEHTTTKRGQFRRRRPTYTTTSTETTSKSSYDTTTKTSNIIKSRFRGRTSITTPIPESHTDNISTTVKNNLYSRRHNRPRLSERHNNKHYTDGEDQDLNDSINRPQFVSPETDQWSSKLTADSFKPFNPNDFSEGEKLATTERRSDKINELDIITARNDYDDILISVTPTTNTTKDPEIPPTLESFVEQTKTTKSESADTMTTFESMLEEVMKSLEEQDQDEYTKNVVKHKGGEIGEIPPEQIISSGENFSQKNNILADQDEHTGETTTDPISENNSKENQFQRRGFWKKVKVRPLNSESIEVAESQFYGTTVNRIGESIKTNQDKRQIPEKPKVTTYKPTLDFFRNIFGYENDDDIKKSTISDIYKTKSEVKETTEATIDLLYSDIETTTEISNMENIDVDTSAPDSMPIDKYEYTTEFVTEKIMSSEKFSGLSFMDYLFGVTSKEENDQVKSDTTKFENFTEQVKSKTVTTESTYMPEEITTMSSNGENTHTEQITMTEVSVKNPTNYTKESVDRNENVQKSFEKLETSSVSSFMDTNKILSTSMSTEISHETEICFRGKCFKTSKNIL